MKTRDRQRVLVQLKDHLYNLGVMNQYMMAEDQNLLHGVRRTLNTVLHNFYKKALSISLTRQEWNRYNMRRKSLLINQIDTKDEVSTLRKLVARLYNASGHSYESYLLVRFLCQLLPPQLFLPLSVGG